MKAILFSVCLACLPVALFAADIDAELDAEKAAQTATSITIIFDTSGSMAEKQKMEQAKRAFTTWLTQLPEQYNLCLIDFSKGRGRLVVPLGPGNRPQVAQHVLKAEASGKTPICECLKIARDQIASRRLKHSPYERHVVVVFTDGKETVDKRLNPGVVEDIKKLRATTVEVVGIGFHGEGDYLKPAATTFFTAGDEKELIAGLSQVDAEIGDDRDIEITNADLAAIAKAKIPVPPAPDAAKK